MSGTYEDLRAWQLSMELVVAVYGCTQRWPDAERYGLVSQIRRAAVSIPSNISEGKGRASDREFIKFLNYARGSVYEVQTQIKLACRLRYLSKPDTDIIAAQAAEVGRVINGLIRAIGIGASETQEPEIRTPSSRTSLFRQLS